MFICHTAEVETPSGRLASKNNFGEFCLPHVFLGRPRTRSAVPFQVGRLGRLRSCLEVLSPFFSSFTTIMFSLDCFRIKSSEWLPVAQACLRQFNPSTKGFHLNINYFLPSFAAIEWNTKWDDGSTADRIFWSQCTPH